MTPNEYRALLDLWMCSDPWPKGVDQAAVESFLEREAHGYGYSDIVEAYHAHYPAQAHSIQEASDESP